MDNLKVNKALRDLVNDPFDPMYNFILGYRYEMKGQTTSAFSFYLRAAEFSNKDILSYESLLRCAKCLDKAGNRIHSLKGMLLRAISLLPKRPEAYNALANIYQFCKDWHECYAISIIGESLTMDVPKLMTDVDYPGRYSLTFHRMVSAWNIGLFDESIYLMRVLNKRNDMLPSYSEAVKNNLQSYGRSYKKATMYHYSLHSKLLCKFNGSEKIIKNYSQCYQDMFVLTMTNGMREGIFLEIGCDHAYFNSNTALLEKSFSWGGISIDIDPVKTDKFRKERNCKVITGDALQLDFSELLKEPVYNYLQVDCDPASTSFKILQRIPFKNHKFAVITFEHDNYCDEDKGIKEKSRKYLESYGYKMIVNNIAEDRWSDFEDWYVHPDLIDPKIIEHMLCISDKVKKCDHYMLNKL